MIKKCPCCGSEVQVRVTVKIDDPNCTKFYVLCRNCELETKLYKTMEEAVNAWNRRTK